MVQSAPCDPPSTTFLAKYPNDIIIVVRETSCTNKFGHILLNSPLNFWKKNPPKRHWVLDNIP